MEKAKEDYYTTRWSYPDVVMRFAGVDGPMRNEESQTIADFGHRPDVKAYTENQWHPLMWQNDSAPTTVFEVPVGDAVPEGLHKYADELV